MTTHLRARAAQAVGLLALVVGGIAVAPGVALANAPNVQVNGVSPDNVLSGGKVTLQYTVTNNNGGLGGGNDQNSLTVDFGLPSGVQCSDCGQQHQVNIAPGQNQTFTVHLTMPQVGAGQSQKLSVTVTASFGKEANTDQGQVTVQGPDKPQSVRAITGKVKDTAGKGVSGATVAAQDSAGKPFQTTTTGSGSFSILSSDANPITPGRIQVGAGKNGFADGTYVSVQGEAGKTVNVTLVLKPEAASSASASASATPTPSDGGSLDPGSILDTNAPAGPSANLQNDDATKNASQDSGSGSLLFVVLGGLLVAAGIGAIVLVLMRRKNASKTPGGPDGGDPTAMGGGPGVVPPSQGRFNDATRVGGAPIGGMGNPAAATMVAPRSGAPSMSDAPTMLHRPVPAVAPEDEFPDPYGAPLPQPGGYAGAAAGGWDDQDAGQYSPPNQYGAADDYAGTGQYGGGNGQYDGGPYGAGAPAGGQPRFDEHTSLYQPESEPDGYGDYGQGGYGGAAGGGAYGGGQYGGAAAGAGAAGGAAGGGEYGGQYGGGAYGGGRQDDDYGTGGGYQSGGGYGQEQPEQGGYGSWGAPAGGVDSGNGYVPQGGPGQGAGGQYGGGAYGGNGGAANGGAANGGGAYGGGQYGGAGGYDQGGYEQGYEQQPGPAAGQYGGGQYGGAARPPQQPGGGHGYEPQDEENGGYGGRRGYEDDQQPSRRGGPRRPGGY
ncbi:carboxypeptidase-like regulatory domain-containing protein [Actinoplanes sp. NPDC051411]|uniref:carboxypeptidase-like regulatory domain-containing protein n=1 Tax=Actinoplanes sp. NPDC051411 TaxID=3155522 RepID=UPI00343E8AAA